MSQQNVLLEPGTLWHKLKQQTHYALNCGALQPIPTQYQLLQQDNVQFLVRILSNLVRKDKAKKQQEKKKDFNPFLPYEKDLFVADISDTHLCLLNKFNVVDYHLLIITRAFEDQEEWLNIADFQALGACLAEIDGLGFYNAGKLAGASQRHKHLQLVPLPLIPEGESIPIEALLEFTVFENGIGTCPKLPFRHAIAQLEPISSTKPFQAAQEALECYTSLLIAVGIDDENDPYQAYNLLVTRKWMMIVARSQESWQSISVNSLGFAGALLVRNQEQLNLLKEYGAMNLLKTVSVF